MSICYHERPLPTNNIDSIVWFITFYWLQDLSIKKRENYEKIIIYWDFQNDTVSLFDQYFLQFYFRCHHNRHLWHLQYAGCMCVFTYIRNTFHSFACDGGHLSLELQPTLPESQHVLCVVRKCRLGAGACQEQYPDGTVGTSSWALPGSLRPVFALLKISMNSPPQGFTILFCCFLSQVGILAEREFDKRVHKWKTHGISVNCKLCLQYQIVQENNSKKIPRWSHSVSEITEAMFLL